MNPRALAGIISVVTATVMIYLLLTSTEGFVDAGRCGVGLPSCSRGLRCINGYCRSDKTPVLPVSDLPMIPDFPHGVQGQDDLPFSSVPAETK